MARQTKKQAKKPLPTFLTISSCDDELGEDNPGDWETTILEATTLEEARIEAKLKLKGDPNDAHFGEHGDINWGKDTVCMDQEGGGTALLVRVEGELPMADWYLEIEKHLDMMVNMPEGERDDMMRKKKYESAKATYLRLRNEFEGDASISSKRNKRKAA